MEMLPLQMTGITKAFSGVRALDGVSLEVRAGEVHALVGENGAGKSTLMNVLAGHFDDYRGEIRLDGRAVRISSPRQALSEGIAVIYQELNVLPNLTVAENIVLGDEAEGRLPGSLDRKALRDEAQKTLQRFAFDLDVDEEVGYLSHARQTLVEIARALRKNAKIIVFDEPTASLGAEDVESLFSTICELKERGLAIVYISHRLAELPLVADRVTVLRDGKVVGTREMADCPLPELTRMMLGRDLAEVFPSRSPAPGRCILSVTGLSRPGVFEDITFDLHAGEVLGLAGLVGSGRTEIAQAIVGAEPARGTVILDGRRLNRRNTDLCRRLGMLLVPEDRKRDGNIVGRPLTENINVGVLERLSSGFGFLSPARARGNAVGMMERMAVSPPEPDMEIQNLSGGNQQKVIVGRALANEPKVILFDEPTHGIDVGTKAQVYRLIADLAAGGCGILLISSELIELANLADRILILREGRITGEVAGAGATEEGLFEACMGRGAA